MKILKRLICILLLPAFLFGCASSNQCSYSHVEKEFQELKNNLASKTPMTEKERYLTYAKLFQDIAKGSVSEVDDFADLTREITNNSFEFKNEEVFVLAGDYAKLFSELATGNVELGIQELEAKNIADSTVEIKIAYLGEVRYSVKMVKTGESWHNEGDLVPYSGELGEYVLQIAFYDSTLSSKFIEKYPHGSTHSIGPLFSGDEYEMSLRGGYTADHGYMIYVGCDLPFSVEEQVPITLNRPIGSISITITSQ